MMRRPAAALVGVLLLLGACGDATGDNGDADAVADTTDAGGVDAGCADVIDATAETSGSDWVISATVLSADTGEEKYADVWEARGPDGTVYVERVLTHPHVGEQPFTRSATATAIPAGVTELTVVAHDSVAGWCGAAFTLTLPSR